jgi:hypothetical protein
MCSDDFRPIASAFAGLPGRFPAERCGRYELVNVGGTLEDARPHPHAFERFRDLERFRNPAVRVGGTVTERLTTDS